MEPMVDDPHDGEETRHDGESSEGRGVPTSQLIPVVYDQLRALAQRKLAESPGEVSLQATALVHEVYLRMLAKPNALWNDRQHLLAAAAQVIRWILVDRARARFAGRRGGGERPEPLDEALAGAAVSQDEEILALDSVLEKLRAEDPRKYEVVMLRYFGGLSIEETAEALGISPATVKREWNFARAWLMVKLGRRGD
jgi:RNA polymerase sigma factor (TIGR02999 family)